MTRAAPGRPCFHRGLTPHVAESDGSREMPRLHRGLTPVLAQSDGSLVKSRFHRGQSTPMARNGGSTCAIPVVEAKYRARHRRADVGAVRHRGQSTVVAVSESGEVGGDRDRGQTPVVTIADSGGGRLGGGRGGRFGRAGTTLSGGRRS